MRLENKDTAPDPQFVTKGYVRLDSLGNPSGAQLPVMPPGYTLLEVVGKGGWGTVYRGLQHSTGREVAVKILREDVHQYAHIVERFHREARAVSALQHPNIVTLHDFGYTPENRAFMVMELVRGEPLDSIIRSQGSLPPHVAALIARQVAQALACAHDQGIIHRDIKPQNIMVTEMNHSAHFVKVLDFGVAKLLGESAGLTAEGKVFGTPEYISPEAARNLPMDGRSDLYSLGILLYELVSGVLPFTGDNPLAIAMTQVQEPPPPLPPSIRVPEPLRALIFQLLEKSPDNRPESAAEVVTLLERMAPQLQPEQPQAPGAAPPSTTPGRWAWALFAVIFLILAAGGVEWLVFGFQHVGQSVPQDAPPIVTAPPPKPIPAPRPPPTMPHRRPAEGPVRLYLPPGYSPALGKPPQNPSPATPAAVPLPAPDPANPKS